MQPSGEDAPANASGRGDAKEILFVCSDLDVGGTERHLATIATALVRLGWRVAVYSLSGSGPMQAELQRGGVTVILPPLNRPAAGGSRLKRIAALALSSLHLGLAMLRRRPAIVHFMLPEAYLVGAPLAKMTRIPIKIMSRRSLNFYQKKSFIRQIESRLHRSMNAVLGNSLRVVDQLREEGVPPRHLGLIYNGIDSSAFASLASRGSVRRSFGFSPNTLVMCMVANLIPYKGHGDLLEALGQAKKQIPADWHLLLAGRDGGISARLKQQAGRLQIDENISFLGLRSDVPALLAASDIGILCSHEEGFANAILEGMTAGLPMVVTNVGGNAEAVIDGVTGIVVPPSNPDQLAKAIVRLAQDPSMRRAFGAEGQKRAAERFGMARCVAAYDRLYRGLLAGRVPADMPELSVRQPID
ncbi:MAG: glycosyltransferase [Pseudolabrys sp.]